MQTLKFVHKLIVFSLLTFDKTEHILKANYLFTSIRNM